MPCSESYREDDEDFRSIWLSSFVIASMVSIRGVRRSFWDKSCESFISMTSRSSLLTDRKLVKMSLIEQERFRRDIVQNICRSACELCFQIEQWLRQDCMISTSDWRVCFDKFCLFEYCEHDERISFIFKTNAKRICFSTARSDCTKTRHARQSCVERRQHRRFWIIVEESDPNRECVLIEYKHVLEVESWILDCDQSCDQSDV